MQITNNNPLVSVVITSYNRANLIEGAIQSALAQDYPNLEIIISDNCSTDNTEEVIEKYLSNPKIRYYKNEQNIGMIPNFKLATEQRSKGDYITYVSSDDYLINTSFISQAVDIINAYKNVLIVFGKNQTFIEQKNDLIDDNTHHLYNEEFMHGKDVFLRFAKTKALGWGAAFINRSELIALNIFDTQAISLDYEANLLLMLKGNAGFVKQPAYVFRVHNNQVSQLKTAADVIKNYSYILRSYSYALSNNIFAIKKIEKWKNDLLFFEAKYILLLFLASNKTEYENLMHYFKITHPAVYKKSKRNIKWNILSFLYRRPKFTLKFIKFLSKDHNDNLKNILFKANETSINKSIINF